MSMDAAAEENSVYERIYARAREVPPGYVTTYGTIARLVGCGARQVGYAMHYLSYTDRPDVPWQRVINFRGMLSTHGDVQRRLLAAEGVEFDAEDRVDLKRFGWRFAVWEQGEDES